MIEHKPTAQNRFESVIEVKLDKSTRTSTIFYPARKPDEIAPISIGVAGESSPPDKTKRTVRKTKTSASSAVAQA
jgi:hypothetical protein